MTEMSSLTRLNFPSNHLHGTLPLLFTHFTDLYYISLHGNSFTGTIPASYSTLRALNRFDVGDNYLTGSLPHQYTILTKLSIFLAYNNALSGTVPPAILNGINSRYVEMQDNFLWGAFPAIGSDMRTLNLMSNFLSGTIASEVYTYSRLGSMILDNNVITGTLPNIYQEYTRLGRLYLRNNFMTGTLPPSFRNFTRCRSYGFGNNILTGTLPNILSTSTYLFDASFNRFVGSIPMLTEAVTDVDVLEYMYVHGNRLTGTLPNDLYVASQLIHIMVFDNDLTGTLPSSIGLLARLNTLLVQGNRFHGDLSSIFHTENASAYQPLPNLMILDISSNRFSGSTPYEIFSLPSILYVAIAGNCFDDELSTKLCTANQLEVLIIEGLSSGQQCRNHIWDPFGLTNAYFADVAHGSIPDCVFNLPHLRIFLGQSKLCLGIELIMSHLYATSTSNMWKSGLERQKPEQF